MVCLPGKSKTSENKLAVLGDNFHFEILHAYI